MRLEEFKNVFINCSDCRKQVCTGTVSNKKGKDARFVKAERGKFAANAA
jgi:hypothetical protein